MLSFSHPPQPWQACSRPLAAAVQRWRKPKQDACCQVGAFLTDAPTLEYYANQLPCDVVVGGSPFGPGSLTFGLPKGSPLTAKINSALLVLTANGQVASFAHPST
jgi:Bacterial extracellular solute-binding proteins, family 3